MRRNTGKLTIRDLLDFGHRRFGRADEAENPKTPGAAKKQVPGPVPQAKRPTVSSLGYLSRSQWREPSVCEPAFTFELDTKVAQRFNAYAAAALPKEVGGLLRIERVGNTFRATDLAVLEQQAHATYFELEPEALAAWQLQMVREGRGSELSEWRGLIHSHPQMPPFPSATDVENVKRLAGDQWAFSVICSVNHNPDNNYHSVNYAQGQPSPMLVRCLDVLPFGEGSLSGIDLLDDDEIAEINAEAQRLCQQMAAPFRPVKRAPSVSSAAPKVGPASPPMAQKRSGEWALLDSLFNDYGAENDVSEDDQLTDLLYEDGAYELADQVIDYGEQSGAFSEELSASLRSALDKLSFTDEHLSDLQDFLFDLESKEHTLADHDYFDDLVSAINAAIDARVGSRG